MKIKDKHGKWKEAHEVCGKEKPKNDIDTLNKMIAENFRDICIIKQYIGG